MERETLQHYQKKYRQELLDSCIQFWLNNSVDKEHGGIYNSLTREGEVFATDKSVWLQARCAWLFARLCNQYGAQDSWRNLSRSCLDFLDAHAIDPSDKRMYFLLTEDGRALRKRRYYFSETFYIIALAEYAKAFGETAYLRKAREYYDFVLGMYRDPSSDPYKITPKMVPDVRNSRSFANTMIMLNVSHVMADCDEEKRSRYLEIGDALARDIMQYFMKDDLHALLETTGINGEFLRDVTGGRIMNPGHALEGAWFLANQGEKTGNATLIEKAAQIFSWGVERGWDEDHGGLYAFVDVLGRPPEALEHNMKLWWPMCELLICAMLLYRLTGDEEYFEWFERADRYCDQYLRDPEYGEWYGYLTYDNARAMDGLKGCLFKGPFHVPRALLMVDACLGELLG